MISFFQREDDQHFFQREDDQNFFQGMMVRIFLDWMMIRIFREDNYHFLEWKMIRIFKRDHNKNFSRVDALPELKEPTCHRQLLSILTHYQIFIATHTRPHDLTCTSSSHAPRFLSLSSSHPHPHAPPPYHTRTTTQTSKICSPFQCR